MRYFFATLFLIGAVASDPTIEEENVQPAQFGMGQFNPYPQQYQYHQKPSPMAMYQNNQMRVGSDPQQELGPLNPDKYLKMKDEDFPIDYSLPCGGSCGCQQACMIVWWQPCTCRCPPPCGCVGCLRGCCSGMCCEETTTTTTTTTTTPPPITDRPPNPVNNNGNGNGNRNNCNSGSCCNSCSCMPCMMPVMWMCPPRCGNGCCGGSSNCCNSSNRSCCGK